MALDQAIEVLDPKFYGLVIHNAHLECLWTGARSVSYTHLTLPTTPYV